MPCAIEVDWFNGQLLNGSVRLIHVRTRDAGASRNFYQELLGWNVSDPIAGVGGVRAHESEQPWASVVPDGGENIGCLC